MREKDNAIYVTRGGRKMIAIKARVNGVLSLAYVKNGNLIAYEPWEDVSRQMLSGPYMEFNAPTMDWKLDSSK